MSRITSFIRDLVRAANSADQHTDYETMHLLENSIGIIYHLRGLLGYRFANTSDSVFHLRSIATAVKVGWTSDQQVRLAFLEAATMIRDLSIEFSKRLGTLPQTQDAPSA